MSPAAGALLARSLQSVSDQELESAVQANMWERRRVRAIVLQERRAEAQETVIAVVRRRRGQAAKTGAVEQVIGIGRQISRKCRNFGAPVESLAIGGLAGRGRAEERGQFVSAACDQRLAGGADRGQRHHVDLAAGLFGASA